MDNNTCYIAVIQLLCNIYHCLLSNSLLCFRLVRTKLAPCFLIYSLFEEVKKNIRKTLRAIWEGNSYS